MRTALLDPANGFTKVIKVALSQRTDTTRNTSPLSPFPSSPRRDETPNQDGSISSPFLNEEDEDEGEDEVCPLLPSPCLTETHRQNSQSTFAFLSRIGGSAPILDLSFAQK